MIARDWLDAIAQVLRGEGRVDTLARLTARVTAAGVVVRADDEVWTIKDHVVEPLTTDPEAEMRAAARRALEAAADVVPSESGAVLVLEGAYLRFAAATGPRAHALPGVRLPATAGIAGHVVQTHRPKIVADARLDVGHHGQLDTLTGYDTRQILAVPLSDGGVVHGVLELMNPGGTRAYDRRDIARLEPIARVLARYVGRRKTTMAGR